jgi:hypothetical protein
MENEEVTITMTVADWNAILGALSTAPFQVVNNVSSSVNKLQMAAGPQIEELTKKYAPAEEAAEAAE